jgi:hypothetical protein
MNGETLVPLTDEPTCEATRWRPFGAIAPPRRPNYLSLRLGPTVYDEVGVRCEGTVDPRVCEAQV